MNWRLCLRRRQLFVKIVFKFVDGSQQVSGGIGHAGTCAEAAGGDHSGVQDFLPGGACLIGVVDMDYNAILAAVVGGDAHADQLFGLNVQGAGLKGGVCGS